MSSSDQVNISSGVELLAVVVSIFNKAIGFELGDAKQAADSTGQKYTSSTHGDIYVSIQLLGGQVLIAGVFQSNSSSASINLGDYVPSSTTFPVTIKTPTSYVAPDKLDKLANIYYEKIIRPLFPSLSIPKPDFEQDPKLQDSKPHRITELPSPAGIREPSSRSLPQNRSPFNIGASDLDPIGGVRLPGFPGSQGPLIGGPPGGGGMLMDTNHPLFKDRFSGSQSGEGRLWGGDGYLPQGSVPAGARFDPVGPVNGPPRGGGIGIGPIGGRGSRGGPLGSGNPDWDDFKPPGNQDEEWRNSMFG